MGGALSPRWKRGRIGTIACRKYVIDFSRGIRVDREEKKKKKKKKKRKGKEDRDEKTTFVKREMFVDHVFLSRFVMDMKPFFRTFGDKKNESSVRFCFESIREINICNVLIFAFVSIRA